MLPGFVYFFFINSHHFWHCTSTSWTEPERKAFKRHWSAANFWLATVLKERNHTGPKQEDPCLQGPQGKESSSGHEDALVKQVKICPLYPSPLDDVSGKQVALSRLPEFLTAPGQPERKGSTASVVNWEGGIISWINGKNRFLYKLYEPKLWLKVLNILILNTVFIITSQQKFSFFQS